MFGAKYGREVAENIALDHITADHEEEIRSRNQGLVLLKCPNCGGQLESDSNGLKKCKHCGFLSEVTDQEQLDISSVKLPAKNRVIFLHRIGVNESLPVALPPLVINGYDHYGREDKVIDDVYADFEDKSHVELMLEHV